jgi:hypothetical protein
MRALYTHSSRERLKNTAEFFGLALPKTAELFSVYFSHTGYTKLYRTQELHASFIALGNAVHAHAAP